MRVNLEIIKSAWGNIFESRPVTGAVNLIAHGILTTTTFFNRPIDVAANPFFTTVTRCSVLFIPILGISAVIYVLLKPKSDHPPSDNSPEPKILEEKKEDLKNLLPSFENAPKKSVTEDEELFLDTPEYKETFVDALEDDLTNWELEEGIAISDETIAKIQVCAKKIINGQNESGVTFYSSNSHNRVFGVDIAPGLIFKMIAKSKYVILPPSTSMKVRYANMIKARNILNTHQLGLLVLPHAKLFTITVDNEEHDIIAEQKLSITPYASTQEQEFEDYADSLNNTICQLAIFICKTGYSDVEWRNNPVLNNSLDPNGNRKIALLDIEEMESAAAGLFGGPYGRTGLVGLVNEQQGLIVKHVAEQYLIRTDSFDQEYIRRKSELESNRKRKKYHIQKKIMTGYEPIIVDTDSLELDMTLKDEISLYEKGQYVKKEIKLKSVLEFLINEINERIQSKNQQESVRGKRSVLLNVNNEPLNKYHNLGFTKEIRILTKEDEMKRWPYLIFSALVKKGYIFKFKLDPYGYHIQA